MVVQIAAASRPAPQRNDALAANRRMICIRLKGAEKLLFRLGAGGGRIEELVQRPALFL